MPVSHRVRATVVTAAVTYTAHELQIDESARTAQVIDRLTQEPILDLHDVSWSNISGDRNQYRVEGINGDGETAIWRAVAVCASCATQAVWPTPAYDIPV